MIVSLKGVGKRYGDNVVLRDVDLELNEAEVHVLAGENGAGKSTLIKILGGVISDYEGEYQLDGKTVRFGSSREAMQAGVAVIHQELSLIPTMSIADNLLLGDFPTKAGFVQTAMVANEASAALAKVGVTQPIDTKVSTLPIATQQLIEIAKALRHEAKVVIMDEPTSALNKEEAERLFKLIGELKQRGVAIVYITHKMEEIERLADRITVLRDGEKIVTAQNLSQTEVVKHMVGRELSEFRNHESTNDPKQLLELQNFSVTQGAKTLISNLNLDLKAGEVLGLAGLEGSGNSALLHAVFGSRGKRSGTLKLEGKEVKINNPADAVANGIALVTNDRKASGLVLDMEVGQNMTLATFRRFFPMGWHRANSENAHHQKQRVDMAVRAATLQMPIGQLSGGNQQKAILAKWVDTQPKLLMLDEPTRGIDIGAKQEIYAKINEWKQIGMGILLISSELQELLQLSDRIMVLHRGHKTAELTREQATPENIMKAAMSA